MGQKLLSQETARAKTHPKAFDLLAFNAVHKIAADTVSNAV
jgi:hypothetical protein